MKARQKHEDKSGNRVHEQSEEKESTQGSQEIHKTRGKSSASKIIRVQLKLNTLIRHNGAQTNARVYSFRDV